eukprot:UC1_evm2s74
MPPPKTPKKKRALEIGAPQDFEHFLHVGATNLRDVNELCADQNSVFTKVVERRARRLPKTPSSPVAHSNKPIEPAVSGAAAPRGLGATVSKKKEEERKMAVQYAIDCISQGRLEDLNAVLEAHVVDANAVDADSHTLLDIAVLLNQGSCARLLQLYGGAETEAYADPRARARRLEVLLRAKQIALGNIMDEIKEKKQGNGGGGGVNKHTQREHDRVRAACELAENFYRRWSVAFRAAHKPAPPASVHLSTVSSTAVLVALTPPADHRGAVVTRYVVEWADESTFATPLGRVTIPAVTEEYVISGLTTGSPCYVRARAANMVGMGAPLGSTPPFLVPSSWREVTPGTVDRATIFNQTVKTVAAALSTALPSGADASALSGELKPPKKAASGARLTKTLRRGLYLAAVAVDSATGRILASHGAVPMVQLDDALGGDLATNVKWLQRLSLDWRVAHIMERQLEADGVTSFAFRKRAVRGINKLMHVLGVRDLGPLHPDTHSEANGAIVLSAVCAVPTGTVKIGVGSSLSWVKPDVLLSKLPAAPPATTNAPGGGGSGAGSGAGGTTTAVGHDVPPRALITALPACIATTAHALEPLAPGLYLAALLAESTANGIRVLTRPASNTLPCVRVRATAAVSRAEWAYLRSGGGDSSDRAGTGTHGAGLLGAVVRAAAELIKSLAMDADIGATYRLCTECVVDLAEGVSLLLLVPPRSGFLTETSARGGTLRFKGCTSVSTAAFETALWRTYQPETTRSYCRLQVFCGNWVPALAMRKREAIDPTESARLFKELEELKTQEERLQKAWTSLQWLGDVIKWGRAKGPDDATNPNSGFGYSIAQLKRAVKSLPATPRGGGGGVNASSSATTSLHAVTAAADSSSASAAREEVPASSATAAVRRRLTTNAAGTGRLRVLVDGRTQEVSVTQGTTASSIVGALGRPNAELCLRGPDGAIRPVAPDCRPLLMQSRWEGQDAVLVLGEDKQGSGAAAAVVVAAEEEFARSSSGIGNGHDV